MRAHVSLVPMCIALALVAGCDDASTRSARADTVTTPNQPEALAPPAPAETPTMLPATPPPASPVVTVRAHPAPYFPLDLPPSDVAAAVEPFPREVTQFMVARDGCDHFRGEEPYNDERRAFIAENVAELCHGSDATLAMLRRRYTDNPSVTAALKAYDDRIEGQEP